MGCILVVTLLICFLCTFEGYLFFVSILTIITNSLIAASILRGNASNPFLG